MSSDKRAAEAEELNSKRAKEEEEEEEDLGEEEDDYEDDDDSEPVEFEFDFGGEVPDAMTLYTLSLEEDENPLAAAKLMDMAFEKFEEEEDSKKDDFSFLVSHCNCLLKLGFEKESTPLLKKASDKIKRISEADDEEISINALILQPCIMAAMAVCEGEEKSVELNDSALKSLEASLTKSKDFTGKIRSLFEFLNYFVTEEDDHLKDIKKKIKDLVEASKTEEDEDVNPVNVFGTLTEIDIASPEIQNILVDLITEYFSLETVKAENLNEDQLTEVMKCYINLVNSVVDENKVVEMINVAREIGAFAKEKYPENETIDQVITLMNDGGEEDDEEDEEDEGEEEDNDDEE